MAQHAFLAPSGADAWLLCHAKVWRERDLPDESSSYADEGTAAHYLRDLCLSHPIGQNAPFFEGLRIAVRPDGVCCLTPEDQNTEFPHFVIDAEMVRAVQKSIDGVRALAEGGTLYPEQRLSVESITGEPDAKGTSDAVIVKETELIIDDLKYGKGVQVWAEDNAQLLIYGASALEEFDMLGEIKTLRMRISQPRLDHEDEWVLPVEEVKRRVIQIRAVADKILAGPEGLEAVPGPVQCRWCKVKATCPENRSFVLTTVADDFVSLENGDVQVSIAQAERIIAQQFGVTPKSVSYDMTTLDTFRVAKPSIRPQLDAAIERIASSDDQHLATCMDAVDMIESWCKAVRAEIERRLIAGSFTDSRYKLVRGKLGNRAWTSQAEAEATLKAMRLKVDQMYDLKLASPTSIEAVLAATSPRKWKKLQELITRADGKPSVAEASDKRPALVMEAKFDPVPEEPTVQSFQPVPEDAAADLV